MPNAKPLKVLCASIYRSLIGRFQPGQYFTNGDAVLARNAGNIRYKSWVALNRDMAIAETEIECASFTKY